MLLPNIKLAQYKDIRYGYTTFKTRLVI